jgi:hypothetical protein
MLESVTTSSFVIDLARPEDDAELRALLREMPMGQAIQVVFLREPNFFRATSVLGTSVQVFVGRLGRKIIGLGTRAIRPSYINGQVEDAGYLADLRLRPEHRSGTFVARAYRFLREVHRDGRVNVYSTVIVEDNQRALATIAANRAGLPRYTPLGRVLTPMIYLRRPLPDLPADITRGTIDALPEIVAKLNENRLQFAPAYTPADFQGGRLHSFRVEDFYVLRRGGRVSGVVGVWDQQSFRQTVVVRYAGVLGKIRPLVNLFRLPPLPPPGQALRFFYLAFLATDDSAGFKALLRRVYNDAVGGVYTYFLAALHEGDPRAVILEEYPRTPFAGRLFAVTMDGPPRLDERIPYVEAALL